MKQQALKLRVLLVMGERAQRQPFKYGTIVFFLECLANHRLRVHGVARTRLVIEDGGVKLFLGGVMAEDHGLGNPCSLGDFLSRGTAKTLSRKKTDSHAKDLQLSVFRGHSRRRGSVL